MNSHAWGPGLPDQYNGLNEDCLHLMADLGFQWNDISCGTKDMEWKTQTHETALSKKIVNHLD